MYRILTDGCGRFKLQLFSKTSSNFWFQIFSPINRKIERWVDVTYDMFNIKDISNTGIILFNSIEEVENFKKTLVKLETPKIIEKEWTYYKE